jgi:hypothetical protein
MAWCIALFAVCATAARAAETVTVHYYNPAGAGPGLLHEAIVIANRAFVTAHVDVRWVNCNGMEPGACGHETGIGVYEVSVLGASQSDAARMPYFALGHALVVPNGPSVYARIFLPRVKRYAQRMDLPVASVLGYAIAHEVGHLMLGLPEHANVGLMKAIWSRSDARFMAGGRMDFDAHTAKILRDGRPLRR